MSRPVFTPQQVNLLDGRQKLEWAHAYTCPNHGDGKHGVPEPSLIPTVRGWICQFCDYTQLWAHEVVAIEEAPVTDAVLAAAKKVPPEVMQAMAAMASETFMVGIAQRALAWAATCPPDVSGVAALEKFATEIMRTNSAVWPKGPQQ